MSGKGQWGTLFQADLAPNGLGIQKLASRTPLPGPPAADEFAEITLRVDRCCRRFWHTPRSLLLYIAKKNVGPDFPLEHHRPGIVKHESVGSTTRKVPMELIINDAARIVQSVLILEKKNLNIPC